MFAVRLTTNAMSRLRPLPVPSRGTTVASLEALEPVSASDRLIEPRPRDTPVRPEEQAPLPWPWSGHWNQRCLSSSLG